MQTFVGAYPRIDQTFFAWSEASPDMTLFFEDTNLHSKLLNAGHLIPFKTEKNGKGPKISPSNNT
jgi:hypothetical protein